MYPLTWYEIIFISVPQSIFVLKIGFELFNLNIDLWRCFIISLVVGFVTYFLRSSLAIPGIHTIIIIIVITLLATGLNKGSVLFNLAAVFLGSIIMGVIEGVCCPLFLRLTSYSVEDLANDPLLNITGFLPVLVLGLIIYILMRRYSFVIYDLSNKGL